MVFAIASSLITLACQGCVSTTGVDYGYSEPAAEPSQGIMLAVPGSFGSGALNAPTGNAFNGAPLQSAVPEANIRLTGQDAPVSIYATTPGPSAFSLTGAGLSGLPDASRAIAWNASPALASVAAQLATSRYGQPDPEYNDMSFGLSLAATSRQTGLAFDVGVAPRVAIRDGGDTRSRSVGGELRLGQGLGLNDGGQPDGWYVFVGADGEALVWDTDMSRLGVNTLTDMQMTDQLTVGDLQAGISVQRAGGELSFSYIRREMEFSDRNKSLSDTEDFAGITFTMRR
ncbi:MAG: DUF2219 family protein [Hyphomonas sp.]